MEAKTGTGQSGRIALPLSPVTFQYLAIKEEKRLPHHQASKLQWGHEDYTRHPIAGTRAVA